jgi:hypothetical protein
MPTLADLTNSVFSDLADGPPGLVFTQLQVEDFIRGGIADLNRVAPTDSIDDLDLVLDPDTNLITTFAYDTPINLPYRVEWRRSSDGWTQPIPEAVEGESGVTGFVFRQTPAGGNIEFPYWMLGGIDGSIYGIRLHGYAARPLPYTTDPDPALSPAIAVTPEEEYSIRAYAKSAGFDLLAHDRSLFAQWAGQTNNTDVSPTQMMQMAGGAKQEWDRHRSLIRTVRRYG